MSIVEEVDTTPRVCGHALYPQIRKTNRITLDFNSSTGGHQTACQLILVQIMVAAENVTTN